MVTIGELALTRRAPSMVPWKLASNMVRLPGRLVPWLVLFGQLARARYTGTSSHSIAQDVGSPCSKTGYAASNSIGKPLPSTLCATTNFSDPSVQPAPGQYLDPS